MLVVCLATSSSFCQLVKIIGKDTVVVMPIGEAQKINKSFLQLKDSISIYKYSLKEVETDFTSHQVRSLRNLSAIEKRADSLDSVIDNLNKQLNKKDKKMKGIVGILVGTIGTFFLYILHGN